ncbi:hypothetical protein TNCV_1039001 [Trichonephila clavipes]|uniref:Uncharacterized protein n=1 Tax=Trichonephila clavipes TaxID=2585209 RepID=A0A8X6VWC2_TRICX|nr:hypothetical protein TNCV_1039001 [Trichonephila clavipes]
MFTITVQHKNYEVQLQPTLLYHPLVVKAASLLDSKLALAGKERSIFGFRLTLYRRSDHSQLRAEQQFLYLTQDVSTEYRAGSQWFPITSSREDRHVTHNSVMDRAATSRALSQEFGSFARQHGSPRTVCCSMDSQLRDHSYDYPCRCIEDRSVINGVLNDVPGARMARRVSFLINLSSAYSIKVVASVIGGIVVNAHW